jgi:hypothetical protein
MECNSRYPGRIHLIRYEDLSMDTYDVVDELFDFLDLPPSEAVDAYIKSHTNSERLHKTYKWKLKKTVNAVNPYGKYRNSKETAVAWRKKMDIHYIKRIQGRDSPMFKNYS